MFKKLSLLLVCFALITGCGPTNQVISPIKYQESIKAQTSKNAYIYWVPGRCVAGENLNKNDTYVYADSNQGGGLVGIVSLAVSAAINNQHRKNNPSQYTHQYSKADQTVFITSLRDALLEQDVFKDVELVTNLENIKSKDVVIKIYFETARANKYGNVTLTTKLTISGGNKPKFEKTYFVQNDDNPKAKTFVENKSNASQILLADIMKGIERWHKGEK